MLDRKRLSQAGGAGLLLAGAGIGLFLLLWVVLGDVGVDQFTRLILSLCVPPALIALVIGIYFLVTRSKNTEA